MLALQNAWGVGKTRMMETLVRHLSPIPIPYKGIVAAYVEIDDYSRRQGHKMGKNDLWIAAARVEEATILTTDRDFSHLPQSLVKHVYVPPGSHL